MSCGQKEFAGYKGPRLAEACDMASTKSITKNLFFTHCLYMQLLAT